VQRRSRRIVEITTGADIVITLGTQAEDGRLRSTELAPCASHGVRKGSREAVVGPCGRTVVVWRGAEALPEGRLRP
jgi:hypothetical protein